MDDPHERDEWLEEDYADSAYYYDEDDSDLSDDDLSETVACPECGADVYEDAEQCPSCGQYITPGVGGHAWQGRPIWWLVLGGLGVAAVVASLLFF